jgi:hypothetical protein
VLEVAAIVCDLDRVALKFALNKLRTPIETGDIYSICVLIDAVSAPA